MNSDSKKNDEVLEGEVVGSTPAKKESKEKAKQEIPGIKFAMGGLPNIQSLKRNCATGCLFVVVAISIAIYTENYWAIPVIFLLPPALVYAFTRIKA